MGLQNRNNVPTLLRMDQTPHVLLFVQQLHLIDSEMTTLRYIHEMMANEAQLHLDLGQFIFAVKLSVKL